MNQPFNPYQHNFDVLRGFFRKPIILLTAISYFLLFITNLITSIVTLVNSIPYLINSDTKISLTVNPNYSTLLFGLAFLILYITARSRKPVVNLKSPVTYFRVLTIIFTVLSGISLAFALVLAVLLIVFNAFLPEFVFQSVLVIAITNIIGAIAEFIFYLALCRFTKGIKYSLTSVFITKTGAKFTAVAGFINAAVIIATTVFGYIFIPSMLDVFTYLLRSISDYFQIESVSEMSKIISELLKTVMPMSLISNLVDIIPFVMVGIVAIMYFRYIRKTTDSLVLAPADNEATRFYGEPTPNQSNQPQKPFTQSNASANEPAPFNFDNQFMYENPYARNTESSSATAPQTPPQDFVPQPVFGNSEKSYAKSDENVCTQCGKKSPAEMNFCPYCGNKF